MQAITAKCGQPAIFARCGFRDNFCADKTYITRDYIKLSLDSSELPTLNCARIQCKVCPRNERSTP